MGCSTHRLVGVLLTVALTACVEAPPAHLSRLGVRVKSACPATAPGPGSVAVDVRAGRRHSESGTLFVTNLGPAAKSVEITRVSRVEGACEGDWARTSPLDAVDADTCKPPAPATLAPGAWQQIDVGDQRVHASWPCTKLALAVWLKVDDQLICADGGAWIAMQGEP
ncbi:MAG TPA: hypothetical protein VGM56_09150 [Byssovorax sp.]|jgi:hypothetical protein